MVISKTEQYFYALILFLMPISVTLSGQTTVIILALLSLIPILKFAFKNEFELKDLILSQEQKINYLNITFILLLIIYAFLSNTLSDNLTLIGRILIMLIAFKALYLYLPKFDEKIKKHLKLCFEIGFILAVILFVSEFNTNALIAKLLTEGLDFERVKSGYIQHYTMNRGACFLTLIFWAIIIANHGNIKKYLFFFTALVPVIYHTGSQTAQLAFIVSNLVFVAAFILPKFTYKFFFLAFVLGNLLLVTLMYKVDPVEITTKTQMPYSFAHRVCIWKYNMDLITQNPFGYGFDISHQNKFSNRANKELCIAKGTYPAIYTDIYYHMSHHPHYQFLQILFELGMITAILCFIACYFIIERIKQINNLFSKNAALALFTGVFMVGLTGYGMWQNWLIASYLLAIALFKFFAPKQNS